MCSPSVGALDQLGERRQEARPASCPRRSARPAARFARPAPPPAFRAGAAAAPSPWPRTSRRSAPAGRRFIHQGTLSLSPDGRGPLPRRAAWSRHARRRPGRRGCAAPPRRSPARAGRADDGDHVQFIRQSMVRPLLASAARRLAAAGFPYSSHGPSRFLDRAFSEGIYVAPADAWIDPSQPKAAGAGHPRPCRPCPRRPRGGLGDARDAGDHGLPLRAAAGQSGRLWRNRSGSARWTSASSPPATSSARPRSCSSTRARGSSSRATISAAPIRPARRSSRCPATSSSPRRPSACPSSAIRRPRARSTGCSSGCTTIPSAASWSAPMRSARRRG